ncbi:MAG: hypothetical protein M3Y84_05850 [Acidobacteriota bacterium]|nr:hypothetical protein [Acidobacteriota bacterium]
MPLKAKSGSWTEIPAFSHSAEQSLSLAATESQKLGHNYIGTEHILLGLLAHESPASQILGELGLSVSEITAKIAGGNITPQN